MRGSSSSCFSAAASSLVGRLTGALKSRRTLIAGPSTRTAGERGLHCHCHRQRGPEPGPPRRVLVGTDRSGPAGGPWLRLLPRRRLMDPGGPLSMSQHAPSLGPEGAPCLHSGCQPEWHRLMPQPESAARSTETCLVVLSTGTGSSSLSGHRAPGPAGPSAAAAGAPRLDGHWLSGSLQEVSVTVP